MDEKYEHIINSSQDFITLINRDYVYTVVNESYCRAIGKERDDILNKSVEDVWGEETFHGKLKGYLDRCFSGEEVHYLEKFKFGIYLRYMHVSYYPYYDDNQSSITHVCVFSHDITKLGEIESKLINYKYRDPITGMFNRRSLEIIMDMELEKAKRSNSEKLRALLYIGIENLTEINRRHGHSIGNILIENAGLKMKELLRNSDYIFRYEGNELVVLLSRLSRNTDVVKVAEKVHQEITTPYNYNDFTIALECYIGISIYPEDGEERETILNNAITALSEAKNQQLPYLLHDSELHTRAEQKLSLERDLHNAFQQEQFTLHYQPIVDVSGKIVGAEALIRWMHPEAGLITPYQFIPLASETGLVREIGKWALFTSTKQLEKWLTAYQLYVSINLSAPEFENIHLTEITQAALRGAGGLDPQYVKFEITESEQMKCFHTSLERMAELNKIGIDIYIDDFGTGLSSLSYLKSLPAKALKIDKVFVDDIVTDKSERKFLKNIIDLVYSRDKQVIVEGVGSEEQFTLLKEMGCERMQGYYFSKPVPAEDFTLYLERGGRLPQ